MLPRSLVACALLLSALPSAAGQVRVVVERVETAPQMSAPNFTLPLLAPDQSLAPMLSPLSLSPAAPVPVPALHALPASVVVIPALPAPVAGLALKPVAPAAMRADAPLRGPPVAAQVVENGAAFFDGAGAAAALSEIALAASGRPLSDGVFIQQEQEGSLISADSRDSSGSVFRYYRPVELRPELIAEVRAGLKGLAKVGYGLRRALSPFTRGERASWDAWGRDAKLLYLEKLEAAVVAERGRTAAWRGKTFLLLTRAASAPEFLAENPDMEPPPPGYEGVPGSRFLQPEIVSGRNTPAASVGEALARTRRVIADTGHAGTQYHVFVKAEPALLRAQLQGLQAALQTFNDALYAAAVQDSFQNVVHASLQPWHAGRSRRVADLLSAAKQSPHQPDADDRDSEKHAFVGLRYWGSEEGKLIISLELRGVSLPFKAKKSGARDMGVVELPRRSYEDAQRWLSLLAAYAESLARGTAPRATARTMTLTDYAADALLSERAAKRGMLKDSYFSMEAMAKHFTGRERTDPGLILPFVASAPDSVELNRFLDDWLSVSAQARALDAEGFAAKRRYLEYQLWTAYADWGRSHESIARSRLASLLAAR